MTVKTWCAGVSVAMCLATALAAGVGCGDTSEDVSGSGGADGSATGGSSAGGSSAGGSSGSSAGGSSTGGSSAGGSSAGGSSTGGSSAGGSSTGGSSAGGSNAGGSSAGGSSSGGSAGTASGGAAGAGQCGTTACTNCLDDDGDGAIDGADLECTGAGDDDEATFATGIPGDNRDPKWQDCFFDGNSGAGDDGCRYHTDCLTGARPQTDPDCQLSKACIDYCMKFTPNGCDCFGCCDVVLAGGAIKTVTLMPGCTLAKINDPAVCPPCTQATDCNNTCGHCELCLGKTELPPDCNTGGTGGGGGSGGSTGGSGGSTGGSGGSGGSGGGCAKPLCPPGVVSCGVACTPPCPAGELCLTGCCTPVPH